MRVVELDELARVATYDVVFGAVRAALVAHAEGRTVVPAPMVLDFPGGDCHVKAGYVVGSPYFAVKTASSIGGSNNGVMLAVSARDGSPAAVLVDEGMLTAWRTAASGALITDAMTPAGVDEVVVLGTGEQAFLQVLWLRQLRTLTRVSVWGRRPDAVEQLRAKFDALGLETDAARAGGACVIATTAARQPLPRELFAGAVHVTGIGTDMPGKGELPVEVLAGALVATDDHAQCLDHGDFGNAVRAGVVGADVDLAVGAVLRDGVDRDRRSVADLTGIGAVDAAVAGEIVTRLAQ
ncbi:ornithine cyclodeaminase family protein [Kribbella sp. NPDC051586]|uniref:ornithine cyclodeaminase family protein n=1 Tax=Kribbella sp. NPDC051586 TaxID=3364118 RepID=UPI0037B5F897